MKTKSKALLLTLCAVLLVAASVLGTMAYLTSTDTVTNTFTVGSVAIKLDEAKANPDGTLVEGADRVKGNAYKLLPGHTYNKDPMVTVLNGSEASYIKMTVTFSKADALDAIFAPDGANLTSTFKGYDAVNWIAKGNKRTRLQTPVPMSSGTKRLSALPMVMLRWTPCLIPSPFPARSPKSSLPPSRA